MHKNTIETLLYKVFGYPNTIETADSGDWTREMNMTGMSPWDVLNVQQMFEYELGVPSRIVWEK